MRALVARSAIRAYPAPVSDGVEAAALGQTAAVLWIHRAASPIGVAPGPLAVGDAIGLIQGLLSWVE
ncbi:MAG TPA: hypothetical protein VGR16_00235 [Thermomicrobiales bacterium]|nr:hypothetical protein [Thermomicrobiales bacterium]